jgi:hypothetical protein
MSKALLALSLLLVPTLNAQDSTATHPATAAVLAIPELVSFWDFQEPTGSPRTARGLHPAALVDGATPVAQSDDGLFGPHSAHFKPGQWLRLPRKDLGPLDIHGKDAQVTLIAWVKREAKTFWQSIAGVWDETHKKRQYMLFLNARARTDFTTLTRVPCQDLIHGHISSVGGPTPGHQVCVSYASSHTPVSFDRWHMLAISYDGHHIRAYLDGKLDPSENANPFPYDEGIYDGGPAGAEFTVGANHVAGIENNNRFGGKIAGLAVFNRKLTDQELADLAANTLSISISHPPKKPLSIP